MIDTVTIGGTLQNGQQIGGTVIDPCYVLAQVTVIHGRGGFGESGQPSSATVVIEYPSGSMPTWQTGALLTLDGPHGRMFAGRIVQRSLTHLRNPDGTTAGQFTITAAGALAALGVRKIGDVPWPQESGTARAARILTAAGTPWSVDGTTDLVLLPRDVDAQPAAGLLDDLASDTQAAVFDTPKGEVVYQALSGRSRPVFPYRWMDFPDAATWADFDPALTWDGASPSIGDWPSPASEFPLVLPCSAIEWEPTWLAGEAAVINHVRVGYGSADPQVTVELEDVTSIAAHNRRYYYAGTSLATSADASALAAHIITTQAVERWALDEVTIALDLLDPGTYAKALALICGNQVTLQGLPQPAPAIDWTAIVEGWTFTQWGTAGVLSERLTLAVSDPLHSLAVMEWDDYPALYAWQQHPAYVTWDDLDTVAILEAAA